MAANLGILGQPIFTQVVLPFALMFVVVFAILTRTKILGVSKQIDSIVAFIFAIIFITVPFAVGVSTKIIPVIGVSIIILLVFMMMWGFIGGNVTPLTRGIKVAAGILMFITLAITVLWATDSLAYISQIFHLPWGSEVVTTVILFIFIAGVFAIVLTSKPIEEAKGKKSE